MKIITPMSRLKHHTQKMENIVCSIFKKVTLNHKEAGSPHYRSWWVEGEGASKGVEADFVMFFEAPVPNSLSSVSFGFSFYGIKKDLSEVNIVATIKDNSKNMSYTTYTYYSFLEQLKAFNVKLENLKELSLVSEENILKTFKSTFLKEDGVDDSVSAEVNSLVEKIKKETSNYKKEITKLKKSHTRKENALKKVEDKIKDFKVLLEEEYSISALKETYLLAKKAYDDAWKKVNEEVNKKSSELNYNKFKYDSIVASSHLTTAEREFELIKDKALKSKPRSVIEAVNNILEEQQS